MKKLLFLSHFLFLIPYFPFSQNVGIGTTTPQSRLHIISSGDEALRLEANQPFVSLYSNGVYQGYFWKGPNSIEMGSAAGIHLPITFAPDGIQKMIIQVDGSVGIGTNTPSVKLEVTGAVKANEYILTTPKTYYYSIDPSSYVSSNYPTVSNVRQNLGVYLESPSLNSYLLAPVTLPHNAIVTKIKVHLSDVSSNDVYFFFARYDGDGLRWGLVQLNSSGNGGYMIIESPSLSVPIDNSVNSYAFMASVNSTNWPGEDIKIRAVIIEYTLSAL